MVTNRLDLRGVLNKVRPRIFDGVVARTHTPEDPLLYHTGPEHRDQSELAVIVEQLPGLPVVASAEPNSERPLGHPDNLLIAGAEYYEIGRVISGKVDDGKVTARIYIHDTGALQEIEDGTKELSLGYQCTLDDKRFQRGVILDHLSVVPRARCGEICSLRTDAMEPVVIPLATIVPDAKHPPVIVSELTAELKIVMDDESKQILADLKKVSETPVVLEPAAKADCACKNHAMLHTNGDPTMTAEEIQKKLDEALANLAKLSTENTTLKTAAAKADEAHDLALNQATAELKKVSADVEKLTTSIEEVKADAKAKVDASSQARSDADDVAFQARVDARVELLTEATKVGIENATTLSDRAIKVAVVKKVDEMDVEDTRSAEYVDGMFAGAMKRHAKADASLVEVRQAIQTNHDAAAEVAADPYKNEAEIRAAAEAKHKDRWRS